MRFNYIIYILLFISLFLSRTCASQVFECTGVIYDDNQMPMADVQLDISPMNLLSFSDNKGRFLFSDLPVGKYKILVQAYGYAQIIDSFQIVDRSLTLKFVLKKLNVDGPIISVIDSNSIFFKNGFRSVEGSTIYSGKTAQVIDLKNVIRNLANNNARQMYAKVPGLNIWENDNSGIQLNIGGRGLSPNRTTNFNTRQNGYDISADALGYPETYYTPPAQAIERIELLRGAASLQFGTQFGGYLNFKLKEGLKGKKIEFTNSTTLGSFGFFNTFTSIGGTLPKAKLNYFAFYQYKQGNGWRPNSVFKTYTAYAQVNGNITKRLHAKLEQTVMGYLAQQAGGLTDTEFSLTPRLSKRERNWFRVTWNLSAFTINYKIRKNLKINNRLFSLFASRRSLGNLQPINRPDYGDIRNLIQGQYANIGNETRLIYRYKFLDRLSTLITGVRLYRGRTTQQQGFSNDGTTGTKSDFMFQNIAKGILQSDFVFPSINVAGFAETFCSITDRLSITPGIRYEYINTAANGYYQDLVVARSSTGVDTLKNEAIPENRGRNRGVFLAGLGVSYKPYKRMEVYGNISQNYRAINFNDMRIVNPNQSVDPELKDEYGFNADLGFKAFLGKGFRINTTLFYLGYNRRIGNLQLERTNAENPNLLEIYSFRTNVGNARVVGIEALFELELHSFLAADYRKDWEITLFTNTSLLDGRYTKTQNTFADGNELEFVPPFIIRTGLDLRYKKFKFAYQLAYTSKHYSDATNAERVANATIGTVPAYLIMDISGGYKINKYFSLQAGVNNLGNSMYFTRRATSYPGPGILPADGRSFYVTLKTKL